MENSTKIICTIGPKVRDLKSILKLIETGMDVARINLSHGSFQEHKETISTLKKAREKTKKPLAIMLDTKGPEIRIKLFTSEIEVKKNDEFKLVNKAKQIDEISICPFKSLKKHQTGDENFI